MTLAGKVALVTGASSGLGATVARLFAERGATVFGIARDTARMATVFEAAPGGDFAAVDVTSPQACTDAVAQCVERFGRLDVLVNAAGFHQMRHTVEVTDDEWAYDQTTSLHVRGREGVFAHTDRGLVARTAPPVPNRSAPPT